MCHILKSIHHALILYIVIMVSNIAGRGIFLYFVESVCKVMIENFAFLVGQAWLKFQGYDLYGMGISHVNIQEAGWPATVDDCLVNCSHISMCKGVTYAYAWTLPFYRCHFKKASRWETSFTANSCCDHYEVTRGNEGEELRGNLTLAFKWHQRVIRLAHVRLLKKCIDGVVSLCSRATPVMQI